MNIVTLVVGFLLKDYLSIIFFDLFLNKKDLRSSKLIYVHLLISSTMFYLLFPYINGKTFVQVPISLIIIASFLIYYDEKSYTKVIYLVISSCILIICEMLSGIILLSIFDYSFNIASYNQIFITTHIIITSLFRLIFILIIKYIYKCNIKIDNTIIVLYPLTSILIMYIFYHIIVTLNYNKTSFLFMYFFIPIIFLLVSNVLVIYIFKVTINNKLYEQRHGFEKKLSFTQKMHQDDLIHLYRNIQKEQHDTKSSYIHLLGLLEAKQYNDCKTVLVDTLNKHSTTYDVILNTGYAGLDAVLSSKIATAQKEKIKINYQLLLPSKDLTNIDELDLSIICANILDNAIESLLKEQNHLANLNIDFNIFYDSILSSIVITCKNPTIKSDIPKTTSKYNFIDHGFGLDNIKRLAIKWNGIVHYSIKDGFFQIIITLSNSKN